jgi:hypothetical protein
LERAAMTVMLAKTYAALKAAGVSDAQAEAAVEELGNLNDQVGGLGQAMQEMHADIKAELVGVRADFKTELTGVRSDFKTELAGVRSDFKTELAGVRSEVAYLRGRFDVLIWAVGINAAATIAILGVLLRH